MVVVQQQYPHAAMIHTIPGNVKMIAFVLTTVSVIWYYVLHTNYFQLAIELECTTRPAIYDMLIAYLLHFNILKKQILGFLQSIQGNSHAFLKLSAIKDVRRGLEALLDFVPLSKSDIFGDVHTSSISVL